MDKQFNTLIAFDFGLKYIGVAVGQSITKTTSPLTSFIRYQNKTPWDLIKKLIDDWKPDAIILGLSLKMDGSTQSITDEIRLFKQDLEKRHTIPIFEIDERLTTKEAKSRIFAEKGYKGLSRETINEISAQLILESWWSEHPE